MKTHKIVDTITTSRGPVFIGTFDECMEWKLEQGFGYKIVTLNLEEKNFYNSWSDDSFGIQENLEKVLELIKNEVQIGTYREVELELYNIKKKITI